MNFAYRKEMELVLAVGSDDSEADALKEEMMVKVKDGNLDT